MTDGAPRRYDWFSVFGVELEYMIVDRQTLNVRPISDCLLQPPNDSCPNDVTRGDVTWSNELVMHVIELKTTSPTPDLTDWDRRFHENVLELQQRLKPHDAMLLPSAMHPWMDPDGDMRLWPYDHREVYEAFDRLFDCRGHGWANLQSVHLNLPFADDQQFRRLHSAIRMVLPILPGLAASSPYCEGAFTRQMDHRLHVYRTNARRLPSVTGKIIPEPIQNEAEYRERILKPMYRDVSQRDPEGILQDEFLNARGAIARFSRGSIEIRLLDVAECPLADLAICQAVVNVVRALCHEYWCSIDEIEQTETEALYDVLIQAIDEGERTIVTNHHLLNALGWRLNRWPEIGELWQGLLSDPRIAIRDPRQAHALGHILRTGPLARRILQAVGPCPSTSTLKDVYSELSDCLVENRLFSP